MKALPALVSTCILLLAAETCPAFSVSYDQKVTMRGGVTRSKVLMKDEWFRIESSVDGQAAYVIKNTGGLFQYLPQQNVALSMGALSPGQHVLEHAADYPAYLKEHNAQLIGTETVDGRLCDVYRFDDPVMQATTTAWVWPQQRLPVKLEVDGIEGRVTVELTNIVVGAVIDDAVFRLPFGVEVVAMGQVMRGVSDLLQRR